MLFNKAEKTTGKFMLPCLLYIIQVKWPLFTLNLKGKSPVQYQTLSYQILFNLV